MLTIREEAIGDRAPVREVNLDAFPTASEADLVDSLRQHAPGCISLVAEEDGEVVGHIMFSPVQLKGKEPGVRMAGLAPMAVLTGSQKKGIGSLLVERGLKVCQSAGFEAVVVLGHSHFYPRFGFIPSVEHGISSEYEVPDDVFMVKELVSGVLTDVDGIVVYHECFKNV